MSDDDALRDMRAQIQRGEQDAAASMAQASVAAAQRDGEDVVAPRHALAPLQAPPPAPAPAHALEAVRPVAIPAGVAPENRAQLERLTDALLRGDVPQREYDELVPFLLQRDDPRGVVARGVQLEQQAPQPSPYVVLEGSAPAGVTLRCAACGSPNDTARGLRCGVCGEALTLALPGAASPGAPVVQAQPPRDDRGRAHREVFYTLTAPMGSFAMAADGSDRVEIHDGFFFCDMHGTQLMAERPGGSRSFAVFVLLCQWTPRSPGGSADEAVTWFVSQRFSSFEVLDDKLRRRLGRGHGRRRSSSSGRHSGAEPEMPAFPAKYHWSDQLQKRRRALGTYLKQLLRFCAAHAARDGALSPELDQFLTVSRQVEQFRRRALPPSVASALGGAASVAPGFQPPPPQQQQQPPTPMDSQELVQAESAVQLLQATLEAGGDLRRDQHVQQHLAQCLALLPALRATADVDSPFVDVDLVPRALQCQEDLELAVATYNDSLLASLSMVGGGTMNGPVAGSSGVAATPASMTQQQTQQPLAAR